MPTHVRHVFLTGFPGVGKTTTMFAAIEELGKSDSSLLTPEGFYTEDIRDEGGARCGFDIVTFPAGPHARRGPLARLVAGGETSPRPFHRVGRYAVDVASLEALACPALSGHVGERLDEMSSERANPEKEKAPSRATRFVAVDEIGKMECLSARFERSAWEALESPETIVLGTIPVRPNDERRDGRKSALARSVAARPDVAVVRVTRDNRAALRAALVDALRFAIVPRRARDGLASVSREDGSVPIAPLAPFLDAGQRRKLGLEPAIEDEASLEEEARPRGETATPCGPLVVGGDAHRDLLAAGRVPAGPASFPPPRTLLLGETSSPAPPRTRPERAYAERSMWRVLDDALASLPEVAQRRAAARDGTGKSDDDANSPILIWDGETETDDERNTARVLTRRLLATFRAGLAVWDVAAEAHAPGERRRPKALAARRGGGTGDETPGSRSPVNDVLGFLKAHPTVTTVAFIGEKAWRRFRSAPANKAATREEKNASRENAAPVSRRRRIEVEGRAVAVAVVRSARGDECERREKVREWSEALFGKQERRAEPARGESRATTSAFF